jgi:calpain
MSAYLKIFGDVLETLVELSQEEVDDNDAHIEAQERGTVENPFSNMLQNLLSGGGRTRRQRITDGEIDPSDNPAVSNGRLCEQDFEELRAAALESGELFEDPEFPPDDQSLFFSKDPPYAFEWKRASEICDNPRLFEGGASRFDINQGELGDCWLLAALANLAMNKKQLYQVVPRDQSFTEDYAGIFHFKFWQYGEWVDVVIDDYLPTKYGSLVFMHSDSNNEFWTALLEKAYAKLFGSYEALKGGTTSDAMVDFTGGCTEMYQLKDADCPDDLFKMMEKAYRLQSMKGCSIDPDPDVTEARMECGLVRGHAYSITKVLNAKIETPQVSGEIPLVRIRNPWGNETEWNGAWSDGSAEWQYIPDDEKENIGLNFDDDGEFWMSYKDFKTYWDQLEICNLNPITLSGEDCSEHSSWKVKTVNGSWVAGESAGGCRNFLDTFASNPQFRIRVDDPDDDDEDNLCTVIISLMQKGRRALRDEGLDTLTIGFAVYYLRDPDSLPTPLDTEFFK